MSTSTKVATDENGGVFAPGDVVRYDITQAFRADRAAATMAELAREIHPLPEQASVANAMEFMLRHREHILLVVDEYGGVAGILTLEDAIETLLGLEIVDETDTAVDLQRLARDLAQRRRDDGSSVPQKPDNASE